MTPQTQKEYLSGHIERITYHNKDNGFCILRVKIKGYKDLVTVTGNSPNVSVGEYIKCSGIWYNDRNHGKQFKADFLKAKEIYDQALAEIEKLGKSKNINEHVYHFELAAFPMTETVESNQKKDKENESL